MLMKILRRLTLEEIIEGIKRFERDHGMTFDEFEELLLTGREEKDSIDSYFRWADLVHAYRGYIENGEIDCVIEELYDLEVDYIKTLTPKRLELLYILSSMKVESINDLARKVHRNVKNVHRDLQALRRLGLISLKKKGRSIIPEVMVEEITFIIR